jgi:hypothetical protein
VRALAAQCGGDRLTDSVYRIDSVLKLLEDGSIEEEDRPEALKELLSSCLISASGVRPIWHPGRVAVR